MRFNIDKCKVLPLNVELKGMVFRLGGEPLKTVTQARYLGIMLSRGRLTTLYGNHIKQVLEKAEVRANAIRHLGYHSDGLRPQTSIAMYKTLVRTQFLVRLQPKVQRLYPELKRYLKRFNEICWSNQFLL